MLQHFAILLSAFRAGITATIRINTVRLGRAGGQQRAQNAVQGEMLGELCARPLCLCCCCCSHLITTTATDCYRYYDDCVQDAYSLV